MLSKYNPESSLDDAKQLAKNLGINIKEITIEDTVENIRTLVSANIEEQLKSVVDENIQSRLEQPPYGTIKSVKCYGCLYRQQIEMAVGYATLYGDLVGDLRSLKMFTKQMYIIWQK